MARCSARRTETIAWLHPERRQRAQHRHLSQSQAATATTTCASRATVPSTASGAARTPKTPAVRRRRRIIAGACLRSSKDSRSAEGLAARKTSRKSTPMKLSLQFPKLGVRAQVIHIKATSLWASQRASQAASSPKSQTQNRESPISLCSSCLRTLCQWQARWRLGWGRPASWHWRSQQH